MQAKQLTDTSWLLTNKFGQKSGMVILNEQGNYKLLNQSIPAFSSLEAIANYFKESLEEVVRVEDAQEEEPKDIVINDFPIKHDVAVEIEKIENDDVEFYVYKTKEGGKAIYAAGYYGVKFKSGYVSSFCPKVETILENDFIGPFKTKFDMQFQIGVANRDLSTQE